MAVQCHADTHEQPKKVMSWAQDEMGSCILSTVIAPPALAAAAEWTGVNLCHDIGHKLLCMSPGSQAGVLSTELHWLRCVVGQLVRLLVCCFVLGHF